jgi:hypothetical protein
VTFDRARRGKGGVTIASSARSEGATAAARKEHRVSRFSSWRLGFHFSNHLTVMRNFVQETVFRHNWSFVTPAVWRKYPNSKSPDVTNVDILSREVVDGKLHTRRLISSANPVPAMFRRMFGGLPAETYMLEESVVDPVRRTMEMKTRNITLKQLLEVQEVCVYREAGSNTSWTQMSQEFSCSILGTSLSGMGSMVAKAEQAIINRVQSNASKGAAILNEVVEGLMKTELKTRGDALNIIVPA